MAVGKIRAGQAGSMKKLKQTLKESAGGDKYFTRIQPDSELTGRFLDEPYDFVYLDQHFNPGAVPPAFPCNTGDCEGCDEGMQVNRIWVAPFVDLDNNKVIALQLTKSVVDALTTLAEKRGTILNRDITIQREGSGKENTKYSVIPDDKRTRDLSMFEPPDIMGMIEAQLEEVAGASPVDDEDDDDADYRPVRGKSAVRAATAKKAVKAVRRPRLEDDDDDDEPVRPVRRPVKKVAPAKKIRRPLL